jgi:hypothetical protein
MNICIEFSVGRVCIDNNSCRDCTVVKVRYNSIHSLNLFYSQYLCFVVVICSDIVKSKINSASFV